VHQTLGDQRNVIDNWARCERDLHGNPGLQAARFNDDLTLPFYVDGKKCFFAVFWTTAEESIPCHSLF
jgi:hypothetical protein